LLKKRSHVIFLIYLAKVFVGFNFTTELQRYLLQEVKSFKNVDQKFIAISNGFNDDHIVRLADCRLSITITSFLVLSTKHVKKTFKNS
jgi:hypothetical protein